MNRLLLVCNVVLALFLAIRLADTGTVAVAKEREPGAWSAADMRVFLDRSGTGTLGELLAAGDEPADRSGTRVATIDLGAELPGYDGRREPLDLGLKLEPMRDFVCYQVAPGQLQLVMSSPLPLARQFHLHFGRQLIATDGRRLPAGTVLAFESARQYLRSLHVEDSEVVGAPPSLVLQFGFPALPAAVRECVRVRGRDGDVAVGCEPMPGDACSFRLQPAAAVPDELEIVVDRKLAPLGGELPMTADASRRVTVYEPLELRGVTASHGHLDLAFNRGVPLPALGLLRVEPPLPFQVQVQTGGLRLIGDFAAGTAWSVRLGDGFPGAGRVRLPHATARSVLVPDRGRELELAQTGSVLSSRALPQLEVQGVNVGEIAVRLRQVYTNNVVRLLQDGDARVFAPAEVHRIPVPAARNQEFTTAIDLQALLGERAHGLYQVELWDGKGGLYPRRRLLQVTDLGVTVRAAADAVAVQVVGIADGEAVAAAVVEVVSPTNQLLCKGATDAEGVALLRWPGAAEDRSAFLVRVRTADDEVFVDLRGHGVELADQDLGGRPFLQEGAEAWVWPTRGIARPGERIEAAVVLRDAAGVAVVDHDVAIAFVTPAGRTWRTQRLRSGASGMLTATLELGADAPSGSWRIEARADNQLVGAAAFLVEAFVPNRLEAAFVSVPPLRLGQSASVRVRANWLDGSPAAGRPVQLRTRLLPGVFAPAGLAAFSFAGNPDRVPPGELDPLRGVLDERGEAELVLAMPGQALHQVLQAQLSLEVLDPSGRAVHAAATALVLRPQFLLGVRGAGDTVEVCAVDADGQPFAADLPVTVRLERRRWTWHYQAVGASRWRWQSRVAAEPLGEWHAAVQGGRVGVALPAGVPGDGWLVVVAQSGDQQVEQELGKATARPDRLRVEGPAARVAAGASAAITVTSPAAGRGFVTVEASSILATRVVELQAGDNCIDVPLPAGLRVPNVHVVVTLTRPARTAGPGDGPPWLIGGTSVALLRDDVASSVTLAVPDRVLPESEVACEISAPGATRALVALVDEGVLQITEHRDPDPLAFFLARRRLGGDGADTGAHLLQGMTFAPGAKTGGDGGDEMSLGGSISPLIRPLAMCREVDLDASGQGRAGFRLPAYEGRVRWLVVAAGPAAVGAAAAPTVVKAPLGLMLAGPRMVAPGDRFVVPVTLRNDTGAGGVVQLRWQASDGLELRTPPPGSVALAAGAVTSLDVEVVAATPVPGRTPRLSVAATLGQQRREVAQEVLVRSPVAFATDHLGIDLSKAQDIEVPADWQQDGLQVALRLSSHPDQHLRPALQALLGYPHGCLEQTTSKGMALLACQALLPRILGGEAAEWQAAALVQAAVDRVLAMQAWNGGFGWWPSDRSEYLFGTVYATDFLLRARAAGAEVAEQALQQAVDRLQAMVEGAGELSLRCHAIEVLARASRVVQPRLDWLCLSETGAEDRVLLAMALLRVGERQRALAMLQQEDGDGALTTGREPTGLLRSPLRLTALRFSALLLADPTSPLLPEQALALQHAVLRPQQLTTQEQARVLAVLAEYFRVQPPAGAVRLSGTFAGSALPAAVDGAVHLLAKPGAVLHLDAGGSGFALLTVRGFRPVPAVAPRGDLRLRMEFVDPDSGASVQRLRRGRVYDLRIHGATEAPLANVVITNLLPGGVEAELPRRGVEPAQEHGPDLLRPTCIERRDDRVLLFVAPPLPKAFTLVHRVRAVFPGDFACPPLLAQAMYEPGSDSAGDAAGRLEILP